VAVPHWPQRKPWALTSGSQLRPGTPPSELKSERWARDYNEIKAMGARAGSKRSAEQTEIARFWEATLPSIYHGVVRSVAEQPGRDLTQNARLFAAVGQASDDALIAVFDAKYHYNFWRPVTAIRNGDMDGNDATERDASWLPLIETPMHPEYPCAHCTVAGAVGAVLRADIGSGATPKLATTSYLLRGVTRSWASVDAFVQEVAEARIYDGVHHRQSTEVGSALGRRVGEAAAAKLMR
jgi:PAP2 superfamily